MEEENDLTKDETTISRQFDSPKETSANEKVADRSVSGAVL